jgi:hypothetical protein
MSSAGLPARIALIRLRVFGARRKGCTRDKKMPFPFRFILCKRGTVRSEAAGIHEDLALQSVCMRSMKYLI